MAGRDGLGVEVRTRSRRHHLRRERRPGQPGLHRRDPRRGGVRAVGRLPRVIPLRRRCRRGFAARLRQHVVGDEKPSMGNGTYFSGPGFDLVTGLGTPVWTSIQPWLGQFDMGAPRGTRFTSFAIAPQPATGYLAGYQSWSGAVPASEGT